MRTVLRVMLCLLLFSTSGGASAQEAAPPDLGSVDTEVTIVGRDDTVIPLPAPLIPPDAPLPELDLSPLEFTSLPAITPPIGWTAGRMEPM